MSKLFFLVFIMGIIIIMLILDTRELARQRWEEGYCWGLQQGRFEGKYGIAKHNEKFTPEKCLSLSNKNK